MFTRIGSSSLLLSLSVSGIRKPLWFTFSGFKAGFGTTGFDKGFGSGFDRLVGDLKVPFEVEWPFVRLLMGSSAI